MNETRALLERVGERFAFPERAFERLERRRDRKRRNQRITAGVVGIAVFAAAVWVVTLGGSFDSTGTPASTGPSVPTETPADEGRIDIEPLMLGRFSRTVEGITFSLRVPTYGWEAFGGISINKSIAGPQGAEAMIFWTSSPVGVGADPCSYLREEVRGPSVGELAKAVARAPGTELVSGPSFLMLGHRPAEHVVLTVRETNGCNPGFFYTWRDIPWGALFPRTTVGDTIRVWIIDVDGKRLFIEAVTTEEADADLEKEIEQIVGSIRFD